MNAASEAARVLVPGSRMCGPADVQSHLGSVLWMADFSNQVLGCRFFLAISKDCKPCRSALIRGRTTPVIIPCGLHVTEVHSQVRRSPGVATMYVPSTSHKTNKSTLPIPASCSPLVRNQLGLQRTGIRFQLHSLGRWTTSAVGHPRKSRNCFSWLRRINVCFPPKDFRNCNFACRFPSDEQRQDSGTACG